MPSLLTALLCIGLPLSQRISTQMRMHDTPTLSVHPGPAVASGENVTFSCHLETGTSRFFLLREGKASRLQQKYGKIPAEFPLGPVTAAHRGTYRCFGSYNSHLWSFPSEPVELLVTGDLENEPSLSLPPSPPPPPADSSDTYFLPTEPGLQGELALWSHNTRNLIRIGLGCLVLLALVSLLVEDWLSRRRTQRGAQRASRKE
ncbi:natural cytotoxicity triggering receptor 1-like isoform X3 [Talpa occidentalis]|uniref:natural cytotoxicity triggering receptor 1-like isoform X3 n=1 Tax=Talpa occidentalis TaxID=50954 RepID=UPI00188F229D|nr:natural cytotoxicity triggering receptor 1-like isoform X3 [Talpa occidentalis]